MNQLSFSQLPDGRWKSDLVTGGDSAVVIINFKFAGERANLEYRRTADTSKEPVYAMNDTARDGEYEASISGVFKDKQYLCLISDVEPTEAYYEAV